MVEACQKGDSCPYSHDRNISRKGTLPCRFFQVGTCANGNNCRFSHTAQAPGDSAAPAPVDQLTIQMDSFTFDQSEAGSEGSYDTSLGSYDDAGGYGVMVEPGYIDPGAGFIPETGFYDQSGPGYWSPGHTTVTLSPGLVVTVLPHSQHRCDPDKLETNNNITDHLNHHHDEVVDDVPDPGAAAAACDTRPDPPTFLPLTKTSAAPLSAEAAEFVPAPSKPKSWAQVVNTGVTYPGMELSSSQAESLLCPFYKVGECRSVIICRF